MTECNSDALQVSLSTTHFCRSSTMQQLREVIQLRGKLVILRVLASVTVIAAAVMAVYYCTTGYWKNVDSSKFMSALVLLVIGFGLVWLAWSVHSRKTDGVAFVTVVVMSFVGIYIALSTVFGTLPFYGRDVRHEAALLSIVVLAGVAAILVRGDVKARARSRNTPAAAA